MCNSVEILYYTIVKSYIFIFINGQEYMHLTDHYTNLERLKYRTRREKKTACTQIGVNKNSDGRYRRRRQPNGRLFFGATASGD